MKVFDGHNDTVLDLFRRAGTPTARSFFERSEHGHIDLPRALEGGLAGGLFALFVPPLEPVGLPSEGAAPRPPTPAGGGLLVEPAPMRPKSASFPPLEHRYALHFTEGLVERLFALEAESEGALRVARTAAEVRRCREEGRVAAVLHFEGAEAIPPSLDTLPRWHERGLRSLGITWSRENAFGHGVPFDVPASPDTGPGLTEAGARLVRRCDELGILLDLAHLNERGFRDVARLSERPLVVSHAAAHALCPATRNLTDAQLDAVAASGGIVGAVFAVAFLREDGTENEDTPLERVADHVVHMVRRMGSEHVGLGSDFDGARVPRPLGDVAGLPRLLAVLRERGLTEEQVEDVAWRSWDRVLEAGWG